MTDQTATYFALLLCCIGSPLIVLGLVALIDALSARRR